MSYKLLSFNNPKIVKGEKISNYLTAIMHLSPINTKICPYQDVAGCKEACLNTAYPRNDKDVASTWSYDARRKFNTTT